MTACPKATATRGILDVWSPEIAQAVRDLAARLAEYPPQAIARIPGSGHDLFKPLYEALFPRTLRHALGEYYTPDWLAEHVLDQVGYRGEPGGRLLDPACGCGAFLMAAVRRLRTAWEQSPATANGGDPLAPATRRPAFSKASSVWNSIRWP